MDEDKDDFHDDDHDGGGDCRRRLISTDEDIDEDLDVGGGCQHQFVSGGDAVGGLDADSGGEVPDANGGGGSTPLTSGGTTEMGGNTEEEGSRRLAAAESLPLPISTSLSQPLLEAQEVCYVRADYKIIKSVQRFPDGPHEYTPEFIDLQDLASLVIILYAVLFPGTCFLLLYQQRNNILEGRPTPRTRALKFLYSPYTPECWFYEFLGLGRKLYLIGFAVLLPQGSLIQLVWAIIPAIAMLAIEMQLQPYADRKQSFTSLASGVATIFTLLVGIVLKTGEAVDELVKFEVPELVYNFLYFDQEQTQFILFGSAGAMFGVVILITLCSHWNANPHSAMRQAGSLPLSSGLPESLVRHLVWEG